MKFMAKIVNMLDQCEKRKRFEKICKMSQEDVKKYAAKELKKTHKDITVDDGFVYAQGTFPVLLVAHMDTVHKNLPDTIFFNKEKGIMFSHNGIGGDDRCGVYMVLETVKRFNCSVLFCEDEEIGGVGAEKFIETELANSVEFNYLIEFDRRGNKDAVFYDCDNQKFTDFICQDFYEENFGSFSDISVLAPFFGVAAVNLSCGYYKAHTLEEYVVFAEMEKSIAEACKILERTTEEDIFEYIPARTRWGYGYGGYYSGSNYNNNNKGYASGWYDDYDDIYYNGGWDYRGKAKETQVATIYYLIEYRELNGSVYECEVNATSMEEAVGMFCIYHPHLTYNHILNILDDSEPYM